jgi:hypothetical protein
MAKAQREGRASRRDSISDKGQKTPVLLAFSEESKGEALHASSEGPNRSWRSKHWSL